MKPWLSKASRPRTLLPQHSPQPVLWHNTGDKPSTHQAGRLLLRPQPYPQQKARGQGSAQTARRGSFSGKSSSIRATGGKTPPLKRGILVLFLPYRDIVPFSAGLAQTAFAFGLQTPKCASLSCQLQIQPVTDRRRWLHSAAAQRLRPVPAWLQAPLSASAFTVKAESLGENSKSLFCFARAGR